MLIMPMMEQPKPEETKQVKEGIENNEVVSVLPSEGLIKYQQKFSERVKGRFG